jgi:WD40 repeat protein/biotin carboxyl carrier protein
MWRVCCALLGALLLCGAAVWLARTEAAGVPDERTDPTTLPEPGAFRPRTSPAGAVASHPTHEPLVIFPCTLVPVREQDVSSPIDGVLREVVVALGNPVRAGQLLGHLDDQELRPQVEVLELKAKSRTAEWIARAQLDEIDTRLAYTRKARSTSAVAVSELEIETLRHQRERFAREVERAREEQQIAAKELERARRQLEMHELRSGIDGEVVRIARNKGEAVKQTEPLFRVVDSRRLRVEGFCKVAQADLIRVGMRALVSPERSQGQLSELRGHTAAVTALAVSADGQWVASASEDRTVMLWAWPAGTRRAVLPHPAEVHALTFARLSGGTNRLLTGCADGRVRSWSITARGKVKGPILWADAHEGAVRALAVSGDGLWYASGGEDRRVAIRKADGQRRYWLHGGGDQQGTAHHGAVTSIHFTPPTEPGMPGLVTSGRDNAVNVWHLNADRGTLSISHTGRTGEVAHLGISPDGRHVLFDHGEELRLLAREDGACAGSLPCRGQGRFQGLALFGPTGRLILAGGSNGRLQLFKVPEISSSSSTARFAPGSVALLATPATPLVLSVGLMASLAENRTDTEPAALWNRDGHAVCQFHAPGTTPVTCGAFAPDGRVVFTGGTDRAVRVWPVPPARQWSRPLQATVTFVGSQVERGTDRVRVRAEVENPEDPARRLRPGTSAELWLYP